MFVGGIREEINNCIVSLSDRLLGRSEHLHGAPFPVHQGQLCALHNSVPPEDNQDFGGGVDARPAEGVRQPEPGQRQQ